jgi:transposase
VNILNNIGRQIGGRSYGLDAAALAVRDAEIAQKYKDGMSGGALSHEYNLSHERIYQILRRVGLTDVITERKRAVREALQAERDDAVAAFKARREAEIAKAVRIVREGGSRNEAARATGLHVRIVQQACAEAGLPQKYGRWGRDAEYQQRRESIIAARKAGKTWAEIGHYNYLWTLAHIPELIGTKQKPMKASSPPRKVEPLPDPETVWTDEKISEMSRMYFAGCSAQHIADVLGKPFTRNSVIGKTNRLRAAGQLKPPTP